MRRLDTNRWVYVYLDLVSRGKLEEVTALLESLFVFS